MPDTTCHMSISLDGFVAGPDQSRDNPLGKRGQGAARLAPRRRARQRGRRDGDRLAHAPARRLRHGPQHVRADPRRVGRGLARLVGRRAAVPRAGLRAHPSRPRADRDGGRDDLPLRHRRLRRRVRAGAGDGRRGRRRHRRRRLDRAPGARRRGRSTSSRSTSPRCCSAPASGSSTASSPSGSSRSRCLHSPLATHIRYRRAG